MTRMTRMGRNRGCGNHANHAIFLSPPLVIRVIRAIRGFFLLKEQPRMTRMTRWEETVDAVITPIMRFSCLPPLVIRVIRAIRGFFLLVALNPLRANKIERLSAELHLDMHQVVRRDL